MISPPKVKVCGITDRETACFAEAHGAAMIGFVFFPKSPRHLTLDKAETIKEALRGRADIVALTVDADDSALEAIVHRVKPTYIQCHGHESPERVADIKRRFSLPIIKAFPIAKDDDFDATQGYEAADIWLFDAKPSPNSCLPGGNGQAFDWSLMKTFLTHKVADNMAMLAGGLNPDNVNEAITVTEPDYVDVSSGIEAHPGVKDLALMKKFLSKVGV